MLFRGPLVIAQGGSVESYRYLCGVVVVKAIQEAKRGRKISKFS